MEIVDAQKLIEEHKEQFDLYCQTLQEYNKRCNLTAITKTEEVFEKHFLDSLLGIDCFAQDSKVLEVGSGGGFPSIPLKICRNDLHFTLLEATGKKCDFLKMMIKNLSLPYAQVLNARAEDAGKDKYYREKFDAVTARAVARLNVLCEYCLPFVKVGGVFVAYKGDVEEELTEAKPAIQILGGKIKEVYSYQLPTDGAKRNIVVIQKVAQTPPIYPRGNGLERKKPIV